MTEHLTAEGKIKRWKRDYCAFMLTDEKWYSQYNQFSDQEVEEYSKGQIKFKYVRKGDFNNIVDGSIEVVSTAHLSPQSPKDISSSYSQGNKNPMDGRKVVEVDGGAKSPDTYIPEATRQKWIVRQSCLKAAVEHANNMQFKTDDNSPINITKIVTGIAEQFEKWVFR